MLRRFQGTRSGSRPAPWFTFRLPAWGAKVPVFATLCAVLLGACAPARQGTLEPSRGATAGTILQAEDRRDPAPVRPLLQDGSAEVRARAALALGRIAHRRDAAALTGLLQDPVASVRATAAFALGLLGEGSATEALGGLLADPDVGVRANAVEAIVRIGAPGAAALLESALQDENDEVASVALLRLWRLQDATLVAAVLVAAEGENPRRRAAAAYSLMRMVGPPSTGATPVPGGTDMSAATRDRAAQALVALASDAEQRVRELAARGLGGDSLPGAEAALLSLLADPSWQVRANALRSLGRLAEGFNPESLLVALQDANVNVRLAGVQALGSMLPTATVVQQVEALREAPELPLRLAAQQALAIWVGVEFLPSAMELADHADAVVRAAAARMLGGIPGAAALTRLQGLLDDASPRVASAALNALAGREGADPRALGLSVAVQASDLTVRAAALGLLPSDDPSVVETLEKVWREAFEDTQADVRMVVSRALQGIPGDDATGLLRQMLAEDPDWRVQVEAAAMLRARGDDPAADAGALETRRSAADYERLAKDAAGTQRVELVLQRGRIVLELFGEDAPLTVANFMQLAGSGYFDGLTFHRVVPNFVIQGGDPRGDGFGGPGHQIRCEINQRPYVRGTLGMALDGKDTGGSQFFITHTPQPHLDGGYTVFGQVVEGMELVDQVVQGEVIQEVRRLP